MADSECREMSSYLNMLASQSPKHFKVNCNEEILERIRIMCKNKVTSGHSILNLPNLVQDFAAVVEDAQFIFGE